MSDQWLGLVDPDTGELVSVGSSAMIGPDTPPQLLIHDFAEHPDFATHIWNPTTRALQAAAAAGAA